MIHKNHTQGQYVMCGGGEQYWTGTNAKKLAGAKMLAGKAYQASTGGKIEIAQVRDEQYVICAVKHGHDAWSGESA